MKRHLIEMTNCIRAELMHLKWRTGFAIVGVLSSKGSMMMVKPKREWLLIITHFWRKSLVDWGEFEILLVTVPENLLGKVHCLLSIVSVGGNALQVIWVM